MNQVPFKNLVLKDLGCLFGLFFHFGGVLLWWVCYCLLVGLGFFKLYRETIAVVWGILGFLGVFLPTCMLWKRL